MEKTEFDYIKASVLADQLLNHNSSDWVDFKYTKQGLKIEFNDFTDQKVHSYMLHYTDKNPIISQIAHEAMDIHSSEHLDSVIDKVLLKKNLGIKYVGKKIKTLANEFEKEYDYQKDKESIHNNIDLSDNEISEEDLRSLEFAQYYSTAMGYIHDRIVDYEVINAYVGDPVAEWDKEHSTDNPKFITAKKVSIAKVRLKDSDLFKLIILQTNDNLSDGANSLDRQTQTPTFNLYENQSKGQLIADMKTLDSLDIKEIDTLQTADEETRNEMVKRSEIIKDLNVLCKVNNDNMGYITPEEWRRYSQLDKRKKEEDNYSFYENVVLVNVEKTLDVFDGYAKKALTLIDPRFYIKKVKELTSEYKRKQINKNRMEK